MSNKKSACDTVNATSTKNNKPNSIISSATEKIKLCNEKNLKDHKSKAILEPVKKMLCEFSAQNEEFARAVTAAENLENLIDEVEKNFPLQFPTLMCISRLSVRFSPEQRLLSQCRYICLNTNLKNLMSQSRKQILLLLTSAIL